MRFIRIAIATLVLWPLALSASAQTFETGVKLGIVFTALPNAGEVVDKVIGQSSRETTSRAGLIGGGWARFPITDQVAFEPELLFVMKGAKLDEAAGGTVGVRVNYFEIPLLARYRWPINSDTAAYAIAGPSFGIRASSSVSFDGTIGPANEDIGSALKSLDLGLAFGGGVEWGRFLGELRYTAGLTDMANASFAHPDSLRNRALSLMIGMKLP